MHESFLAYHKGKYLWLSIALCMLASFAYILHTPNQPPNGGTWLGYTLGGLGAALILWLMYFGIRKRDYKSTLGNVKGWLSAHVYLGLSLIVIATLHSGFQFGWNVHTLAYTLMCLTIISGIFGVVTYARYPALLDDNRDNLTQKKMLQDIESIDTQLIKLSSNMDKEIHTVIQSAVERTQIGGGYFAQVFGYDHSKVVIPHAHNGRGHETEVMLNKNQDTLIDFLADLVAKSTEGSETEAIKELISLTSNKKQLLSKLRKDVQMQGLLEIWLYLHIPLSFGLIGALICHIVAVFIYW